MTREYKTLEETIKSLPPDMAKEVEDFIQFLMRKRAKNTKEEPRLNWRGALKHLRDKFTSVELQHEALDWRGD